MSFDKIMKKQEDKSPNSPLKLTKKLFTGKREKFPVYLLESF